MHLLKKSKFLLVLAALLLGLQLFDAPASAMPERHIVLHGADAQRRLRVELAKDPVDLMRGLMFRQRLAPYDGMLFDFGMMKPIQMWMKNTDIPLDMVFFDEARRVVHIHRGAIPHDETTIASPALARYVLEVDAGKADTLHLATGQHFEWEEE